MDFSRYAGLVFDCDGTLVDTMPTHFIAWRDTLARFGIGFPEDRFYSLGGVPALNIVHMLASEHGVEIDAELVAEEKEALFVKIIRGTVAPVEEVAQIARSHHGRLPMAVATGSPTWLADELLQAVGLRALFATVVGAEQVTRHKPAPDTFLEAARLIGVAAAECCAFEDTDLGVESARSAGMDVIDVRDLRGWR